jgi:hypothetical protein
MYSTPDCGGALFLKENIPNCFGCAGGIVCSIQDILLALTSAELAESGLFDAQAVSVIAKNKLIQRMAILCRIH